MYNIKITLNHKTINHNNIVNIYTCYSLIMSTYRHLKQTNEAFSILLWDKDGKVLRLTNKYIYGSKNIPRDYINYKLANRYK